MSARDLFISYTHIDNQPFGTERGWIDLLHKNLEIRVSQLLGKPPVIWRDSRLNGNDVFAITLLDEIRKTNLLLSVLSPRYLKSKWCLRELNSFYKYAAKNAGVLLNNKARIFKVLKTPVSLNQHPQKIKGMTGYEFYEHDQASGRFREYNPDPGVNRDKRYWDTLEDLAQDITKFIEDWRAMTKVSPPTKAAPISGKTIYLAQTTSDQNESRDFIRRELLQSGHRVLPEASLPLDQRLRDEVKSYLNESSMSVHLIGAYYGIVPEGEAKSIVEIQYELAASNGVPPDHQQMIWMPNGLQLGADEQQKRFVTDLLEHKNLPQRAELLQTKLENLKTFIHEKLNPPKPSPPKSVINGHGTGPAPPRDDNSPPIVYLVCDQPDYDNIAPVEAFLYDQGCEVLSPSGAGDLQTHKENLLLCDAVLIYCGKTTDNWLNAKKTDLIKLPGYGRTKPLIAKCFYLSAPQTSGKERFRIQDGLVIKNYGEFTADSLQSFIAQIKQAKGVRQ